MKSKAAIAFLVFLGVFCIHAVDAYSQTEASGTWSTASTDGFIPRAWFTSPVVNGKIYIIGGDDGFVMTKPIQSFDPSTSTWSTLTTKGTFTLRHGLASSVVNGKIYAMGGNGVGGVTVLNTLEVFDPSTNTWSTPKTTGTFTARHDLTSCVIDGKIYAIGGGDGNKYINTLEVFDPLTNTWSTPKTTGTFTPRSSFCSSVVNGKIYVIGGWDNNGSFITTVQVFDPSANTWTTLKTAGKFFPRDAMASSVINGNIYVIGGDDGNNNPITTNTLQVFDPSTNTWSTPTTTGTFTPRFLLSAAMVNDNIYVMGGQNSSQIFKTNEVLTPSDAGVKTDGTALLDIELSPNPTKGLVTVFNASVGMQVVIENIMGETVMKLENSQGSNVRLDLSKLPSGTYFAKFLTPNSIVTKKIVRE